jgi:hypothetical protein
MRKFATLGAVVALGISGAAFAAEPSHSFVEAGYGYSELGGGVTDGDGFNVDVSYELPANFILSAGYRDFSIDGVGDLKELNAGVGYKFTLSESFDLVAGAAFEQIDIGSKYSGFSLNLGTRGRITDTVELSAGLKYQDMESDLGLPTTFSATMGIRKYFNEAFAAGLEVGKSGLLAFDETSFTATLRYDFGSGM